MTKRNSLLAGSILGFLGVALGAFGAHALKSFLLEHGRVDTFEFAVRYQFYHALALIAAGILQHFIQSSSLRYSALAFLIGVLLFSGSLYLLCFTGKTFFAMITPLGGISMLAGWLLLAIAVYKTRA